VEWRDVNLGIGLNSSSWSYRNDVTNDLEIAGRPYQACDIAGLDYSGLVCAEHRTGGQMSTEQGTTETLIDIGVGSLSNTGFDFS
jgi:hypothetical protein